MAATPRTRRMALEIADEVGFDSARIENSRKHTRLVVTLGSQERFHVLGSHGEKHRLIKLHTDLKRMKREMEKT